MKSQAENPCASSPCMVYVPWDIPTWRFSENYWGPLCHVNTRHMDPPTPKWNSIPSDKFVYANDMCGITYGENIESDYNSNLVLFSITHWSTNRAMRFEFWKSFF